MKKDEIEEIQKSQTYYSRSILSGPEDYATAVANTPVVITLAAAARLRYRINGIAWSYNTDLTLIGYLRITSGGVEVFNVDITSKGVGFIPFSDGKGNINANSDLVITLGPGGVGVVGKLNILGKWLE